MTTHPGDATVAVLGLGRMGAPMAERLRAAGRAVRAYDPLPEPRERARRAGCLVAADPHEALDGAGVLITMLPDERVVDEVAFGPDGLVARWPAGTLWIEMSSSLGSTTRRIADAVAQRGGALVDAPVSGGVRGALAGTLTVMVAGAPEHRERAHPILAALGERQIVVGDVPGAGDVVKSLNNMLSAVNLTAATEAVAIAVREGVDLRTFVEAIEASTGASNAMSVKVGRFAAERRFDSGFSIDQYLKDLRLALAAGDEHGLHPQLGGATRDLWRSLSASGHGELDHTCVVPLLLERDGIALPGPGGPDA